MKGEQRGEEIKKECLSVRVDIVFVNYKGGHLRTATSDFYRRYRDAIWAVCTPKAPAIRELRPGQLLRVTYWHDHLPVKIEARKNRKWEIVFERTELPQGLKCLASH